MDNEEIKKVIEKHEKDFECFKYNLISEIVKNGSVYWSTIQRTFPVDSKSGLFSPLIKNKTLNLIELLITEKLIRKNKSQDSAYLCIYYTITQKGIDWLKKELKNRGKNNE